MQRSPRRGEDAANAAGEGPADGAHSVPSFLRRQESIRARKRPDPPLPTRGEDAAKRRERVLESGRSPVSLIPWGRVTPVKAETYPLRHHSRESGNLPPLPSFPRKREPTPHDTRPLRERPLPALRWTPSHAGGAGGADERQARGRLILPHS